MNIERDIDGHICMWRILLQMIRISPKSWHFPPDDLSTLPHPRHKPTVYYRYQIVTQVSSIVDYQFKWTDNSSVVFSADNNHEYQGCPSYHHHWSPTVISEKPKPPQSEILSIHKFHGYHPCLIIFFFAVIRAMKGASHLRTISGVERTTNVKGLSVWSMKGHTFGMVKWLRCWWYCWWWWLIEYTLLEWSIRWI